MFKYNEKRAPILQTSSYLSTLLILHLLYSSQYTRNISPLYYLFGSSLNFYSVFNIDNLALCKIPSCLFTFPCCGVGGIILVVSKGGREREIFLRLNLACSVYRIRPQSNQCTINPYMIFFYFHLSPLYHNSAAIKPTQI